MSYEEIQAILPSILLGLFCGLAAYFKGFNDDLNHKPSIRRAIANMMSSGIISFCVFTLLYEFTTWQFMSKLAVSCAVAFVGIDKALDILAKLISLRGGK